MEVQADGQLWACPRFPDDERLACPTGSKKFLARMDFLPAVLIYLHHEIWAFLRTVRARACSCLMATFRVKTASRGHADLSAPLCDVPHRLLFTAIAWPKAYPLLAFEPAAASFAAIRSPLREDVNPGSHMRTRGVLEARRASFCTETVMQGQARRKA